MIKFIFLIFSFNILATEIKQQYNCKSEDPIQPDHFSFIIKSDFLILNIIKFIFHNQDINTENIKIASKDDLLSLKIISNNKTCYNKIITINHQSKVTATVKFIDQNNKEYHLKYSYICDIKKIN